MVLVCQVDKQGSRVVGESVLSSRERCMTFRVNKQGESGTVEYVRSRLDKRITLAG
jgi:hypothetical protein